MEIKLAKALPCFAILLLFAFNTSEAVEKKSNDSSGKQKALYIAEILLKHPHLAEQIWNIGFTALISRVGHGNQSIDKETKKTFYNYVLDNIPRLLKNEDFENMIHDISDEFTEAYKKAKLTKTKNFPNSNDSSITHEVASEIIKKLDIGRILKKSAKNGQPLLDRITGRNTTGIILIAHKIIDMVPSILNSTTFTQIQNVVIKELIQGYETFLEEQEGSFDSSKDNVTGFIINVLKHTNLQKLTTGVLLAGKPIIDSIRGKDSTGLLMGLGYIAKAFPKILANEHFQRLKDIAMKRFGSTFLQLNLTNSDLQHNASSVIKDVFSNTNKLKMVQEILKQYSAKQVLRLSVNDSVNGVCYSDSMDFLDSLMNMSPWSVKMFDSIGKLSDGIMDGHLNMVGSFDECNTVHAYIPKGTVLGNKTKQTDRSFNGRFCTVKMKIPQEVLAMDTKGVKLYLTWGLCVPDSCQHNDVKGLLSTEALKKIAPFLGRVSVQCTEEKSVSDDPSAITAIAILAIFGSIMLIGTALELILSKRSKWHKSWSLDKFTKVQNNSKQFKETDATSGNKEKQMSDGTVHSGKTEKLDSKENVLPENYVPHAENVMNGSCKDMCSKLDMKKYYQKEVVSESEKNVCKRNDGVLIRLLTAFAIQVNTKKIISVTAGQNAINCIHGVRFLSITWVILGHSLNYGLVSLPGIWTTVFDSMGKLREGVMHGQLNLVGSFDECMDIQAQIKAGEKLGNRTKETASSFGTRYCRVSMDIPSGVLPIDTKGVPVHLTWGACVPDSCHSRDISGLFKLEALRNMTTTFDGVYVYCFDNKPITEDNSAVAAIVMLSIFGLLIVMSTLYMMVTNMKQNAESTGNAYELPKVPLEMKAMYNMAFKNDEAETKVDLSNRTTDIDIPKGYMPHAESNQNGLVHTNGSAGNGSVGNGNASYEKQSFHQLEKPSQQSGVRSKATSEKKKQGVLHRILKAFALQENVEKILSGKTSGNSINCIHGIRFLSLTWVILGHTFNYGIVSIPSLWTTENIVEATEMMKRFTFQAVIAGGFSVDTFYMISGMLLTYLQIKQVEKLTKRFNCAQTAAYTFNYYFHRIWRLTPMYMMVIMVYGCLMKYFGDGPLWPEAVKTADDCKINWWTNLLYVNNLVHVDGQCMAWSWYLANDMQFYVVSLFFLVFLAISIPVGVVLICLLMTGGVAAAWYEEHIYNGSFFTTKKDGGGYWNNVYISPWCRVAAYCVGMLLGVLLYKRPKKALKTKYALLGWSLATAMGLGLVYCTYSEYKEGGTEWSRDFRAAYESLGRPLWAACVAWVVFACHNGNGGVVNSLLSWKGLIPLSRLSYAAYLVHPIMMMIHVYSKRALVYISDYEIIYLFLGHTCFTFMVAFVVSISFEAPFMALEKIIMGR